MNPLYIVLFVSLGIFMIGLFLYGRMSVKKQAVLREEDPVLAETGKGTSGAAREDGTDLRKGIFNLLSINKRTDESAAVQVDAQSGRQLRISKSSSLVDFDRFHHGFVLTRQGDLVSIMEILPATISAVTDLSVFGIGFARVIHALEDNTRIQVVQMPVPNKISGLLDQYALQANQWKTQAHQAALSGDPEGSQRAERLSAITRLSGYHMIQTSARSSRRASFVVLTENATNLGALTEGSVRRAEERLNAKTEQVRNLFLNNGISVQRLSEAQIMEMLWYAYNPESGAAHISEQIAARFKEVAETGSSQFTNDAAITGQQLERALSEEGAAAEILSPQYLEPDETHIKFNGRRMVYYYVYDYAYSLPKIQDLLGDGNQFGDRLWVSFFVTAPKIEEIVQATKKASTGKQAWQELRARGGLLNSYAQDREIQSIEAAREGSETQENIPRLIGLYLGLMVDDGEDEMQTAQIGFESKLKSRGLEFCRVRFSTLEAWQTLLPLGQRHLEYSQKPDRNIFSQDIIPLNPITTASLIEGGGVFTGYTSLAHGCLSPVSLRRKRGDQSTADGGYRSPSDAFVGLPGSGKSFAMKFMLTQWQAMGHRVVIIEPKPEFKELVDLLGGRVVDIAGKGGFNLFNFEMIPNVDEQKYKQYGEIVFGDNKAALITLYSAAKNARVTGSEISLLVSAMQGAMSEKGMDSKDPTTWGNGEIFLRDVYNYLAHNLRDKDQETIRFMLNVLEQYATVGGQYFEKYNTPARVSLDAELTLMSFGITQFSQDITAKALSYHFALRVAYQSAIKAFLMGEVTKPVHILIDEASQMLINGPIVSAVVEMLSLLNTYNISVHLAFQDMNALQKADSFGVQSASNTTNTLQGMLSTFYLFKQTPKSAEASRQMLDMPPAAAAAIPSLRTGQCLLVFAGTSIQVPLSIIVPDQLAALFDTRPEAQKVRLETAYA